ncbi:LacI family DNA-binding transcriptional regulator [Kingella negevensis]|uniref:Ribose operon repressor n=2 Tax=Kingella negevensis TaxID=1522312 RepID=A0A238TB07_9NEIS|nr:LacI family DNA-binding transcriptional regulator [Kingella negevensis]MDK4679389.1 LacI family DNA-binding transcriptional regulator [Kingella negevensis]MDK4682892.1 LacI family DNA-binding transcriptional regulator [Kingella negevensis]MDK4685215.1 LacI family DNA-binding transcriptional regulator [Kingella negevensis]MDK4691090.1 LacI family DNA-binding transcriptional regulator [Kingella negevensis]MDK4693763.1 LacI family DNA-binding transcriptional regulator [Kingella negevensis]
MTTIYDVAKHAGVSPKTVSRVLNQDKSVKDSTRERVERSMNELGYIPSSAARTLRSHRSGLIGVIMGVTTDNIEAADIQGGLPDIFLTKGAHMVAEQTGKTLLVLHCGNNPNRLADAIRRFQQYRAEGIVCVSEFHQKIALPFKPDCPVVLLNCFDDDNTPAVLPDDESNQRRLTEHLIAHGHKRIAYLTPPNHISATPLRLAGYRAALQQAQLSTDENLIATGYTTRHNSIDDLWQALHHVLQQPERPSVICCGNDEMAMRVYGMLRTEGIKVPEEISVAGFDDHKQIAETLYPALTTVELPYTEMGKRAIEILLRQIEQKTQPENAHEWVEGKVIWRDSVLKAA